MYEGYNQYITLPSTRDYSDLITETVLPPFKVVPTSFFGVVNGCTWDANTP